MYNMSTMELKSDALDSPGANDISRSRPEIPQAGILKIESTASGNPQMANAIAGRDSSKTTSDASKNQENHICTSKKNDGFVIYHPLTALSPKSKFGVEG